jgi:hypothetical protein
MMPATGIQLVEYLTADGTTITIEVSPDIAEVLASDGPRLKEVTFTDCAGRLYPGDNWAGLDPDRLDVKTVRRRVDQRPMPLGSPWDGPRFKFTQILGESGTWRGEPRYFEFCGGKPLASYQYCLDCDRCGKDHLIPTPGEQVRRRAPRPSRSRSGRRLAGGVGR